MVVWYDSEGKRQRRSRATLKEAEELVRKISEALRDKINGAMTLDDGAGALNCGRPRPQGGEIGFGATPKFGQFRSMSASPGAS